MLVDLPSHEGSGMVRTESIVKALGVTDGASFEALMAALSVGKADGLGSQNVDDPTLVHPADAVTRLRQFVEAENSGAAAAPTIGLAGCVLATPMLVHHRQFCLHHHVHLCLCKLVLCPCGEGNAIDCMYW